MSGQPTLAAHRPLLAVALAGALAGAAPVQAQTASVSYPPSRALSDVAAWLQRDTPLPLPQVVDVSPSAVTAVTSAAPMGQTRGFLANIASEAMDPAMLAHDGIASWSIPVEVDCDRRMARLGTMTGYGSRDLKSEARTVRAADMTWVNPATTAPLGSVIRALCDRDFQRPFAGQTKIAAKPTEPIKDGRPPIVEVRPKRVAAATPKPSADHAPISTAGGTPPVATAPTPAPAPSPPAAISMPSTPSEAKPAPKPKPKPPTGGGAFTVQIGASPSVADAQGLVAHFKKKFGAELGGLTTAVATVQVDGKTVNRVLVSGLASSREANGFCKTLEASGQACFVRR